MQLKYKSQRGIVSLSQMEHYLHKHNGAQVKQLEVWNPLDGPELCIHFYLMRAAWEN